MNKHEALNVLFGFLALLCSFLPQDVLYELFDLIGLRKMC